MARTQTYKTDSPLTGNDCARAFERLTDEERDEIAAIVRDVTGKLNKRKTGFTALGIGTDGALELIAKLGIFISQQETQKTNEQALRSLNRMAVNDSQKPVGTR